MIIFYMFCVKLNIFISRESEYTNSVLFQR